MKKISLALIAWVVCCEMSLCQQPVTFYLNSKMEISTKEKSDCKCSTDFDLDNFRMNGRLLCEYVNGQRRLDVMYKNGSKEGRAVFYFANGKPAFEGNYLGNNRSGIWKYFYRDGSPWQVIKFIDDPAARRIGANFMVGEYYGKAGNALVTNGNGTWMFDSVFTRWGGEDVTMKVSGTVKDSLKHGTWTARKVNKRKIIETEEFDKGRFVSGLVYMDSHPQPGRMTSELTDKFPDYNEPTFTNLERFKLDPAAFDDSVKSLSIEQFIETVFGIKYKIRNRSSGYKYGQAQMMQFIARNMVYPAVARRYGYQGTVIVQFKIRADGKASDFKVLKGVHESLENEALRVIRALEEWVPAYNEGQTFETLFSIPVRFQL